MSLGVFTLVKNEAHWIGFSVMSVKDIVDQFVYFDGNSDDGTVELLTHIKNKYNLNIEIHTDKDPVNLKEDYVRLFNECLSKVKTDHAWFLHPDMIMTQAPAPASMNSNVLAYSVNVKSFAGDAGVRVLEIKEGRTDKWKSIMKNSMGLHYYGNYGVHNEDMYFRDITGDEYRISNDYSTYPYEVLDSGIVLNHYSDVRTKERREDRMVKILMHSDKSLSYEDALRLARTHPRVSFKNNEAWPRFEFEEVKDHPSVFAQYAGEFASVLGRKDFYIPIGEPVS